MGQFKVVWGQSLTKGVSHQTFSERRSYERKKSAAHFLLQERMMSAEVSKERKKSAKNKFSKKV